LISKALEKLCIDDTVKYDDDNGINGDVMRTTAVMIVKVVLVVIVIAMISIPVS
jgi:hypothetical protein